MKIVKNMRTLKALAKSGFIELHSHTGTMVTWWGREVKAWYIENYKTPSFIYRNKEYTCKYVDGCFFPYVFVD